MKIEQQRGISVTTSVMTFEYGGAVFNLLDTPGHEDFSEDTYRTLTAVDSAVMVIDAAKGIEAQTRKLFEVCRLRDMPIITFINKMDREAADPFELLDEIASTLALDVAPMTWPTGSGQALQRHLRSRRQPHAGVRYRRDRSRIGEVIENYAIDDARSSPKRSSWCAPAIRPSTCESYRAGHLTPVFFGSGAQEFRRPRAAGRAGRLAPPPRPQPAEPRAIEPTEPKVAGFVFKVQANMDPNHRDRIAFLRLCSGKFRRGMKLKQMGTGKTLSVHNRRSCSSPTSARSSTRPGRATSSAFPTTACCASATR